MCGPSCVLQFSKPNCNIITILSLLQRFNKPKREMLSYCWLLHMFTHIRTNYITPLYTITWYYRKSLLRARGSFSKSRPEPLRTSLINAVQHSLHPKMIEYSTLQGTPKGGMHLHLISWSVTYTQWRIQDLQTGGGARSTAVRVRIEVPTPH